MTNKFFSLLFFLISFSVLRGQQNEGLKFENTSSRRTWIKNTIVPVTLIAVGLITIDEDPFLNRYMVRAKRNEHQPDFSYHIDDYLQYSPGVAAVALNALGVKGRSDWRNSIVLFVKSELLMAGIVFPIKQISHQIRPDSSNYHSFPSGHTAQAFAEATFLHKEFGHRSIAYTIGGYTVATSIAVLRVLNNKHWISDVLVGAGIGILSTNIVYLTHKYKWGKKMVLSPTYYRGPGLYASFRF